MNSPLKILLFDGSLTTTTFINRLAQGLANEHSVHFMGFGGSPNERNSKICYHNLGSSSQSLNLFLRSMRFAFQLLVRKGNVVAIFKTIWNIVTNQKDALKQQNIRIVIKIVQPDILHVQWPSLLPWCEEVIQQHSVKVVLSQRGYQNNVRPFVDAENFKYLKDLYPKIDGFHSVSEAMVAVGDKIYTSPNKVNAVVYSGFNFESLPYTHDYKKNDVLNIISIGRPHWKKGYTYALRAMRLLKEQGVSFHYRIIGGAGNEELLYLVEEFKLSTHVTISEKIPQPLVYDSMNSSDLFLLPSLEEGLPNVMIEAMALGLPVLATDCGGVKELLDTTTGIVIPTRNPSAIADAIKTFAETPLDIINARRIEARKRVEIMHSAERMVAGMATLYYEVG